ncbi:hypothetical protein Ancab_004579, partial [Ancistrocladus abbreviatus]
MRLYSLKAQLNFKKKRLSSCTKSQTPLISSNFSTKTVQSSQGSEDSGEKNPSLPGESAVGNSLSDSNIVNMNQIIIQNQDKFEAVEIWDI